MVRAAAVRETGAPEPRPLVLAAILAASALMMAVTGYSFLGGNHEVYLLEPLRRAGLATFEGDWFVTQTLQYHGLFAEVAALLFRLDVARPAFLVIFLVLLLTTACAWWRIVRALGGDVVSFLVAVVLYHVLLGDRALGFYSLLQDGQFNAANVAAVSLLVGIAMWIEGRFLWAGLAFGIAGAFHLNYAVVAPGIWMVMIVWRWLAPGDRLPACHLPAEEQRQAGSLSYGKAALPLIATLLALVPSIVNVAFALPAKLQKREAMPLDQFVNLYVHLRHPHHYDPLAWPWWVWAAFLVPIPFAVMAWRRINASPFGRGAEVAPATEAERAGNEGSQPEHRPLRLADSAPLLEGEALRWRAAARIWLILMALQLVALLTAGVFWISETFIQLSLWRFSPHAKLLVISAVAVWVVGFRREAKTQPQSARMAEGLATRLPSADPWNGLLRGFVFAVAFTIAAMAIFVTVVVAMPEHRAAGSGASLAMMAAALLAMRSVTDKGGAIMPASCAIAGLGIAIFGGIRGMLQAQGQPPVDSQIATASGWASASARTDSIFLLPPDASALSVRARHGQVVSFKLVPQLSGELIEWDRRLREVLDVPDLSIYAGGWMGYIKAQEAMRRRYDELPCEHLFAVARKYGAQYVFRSTADEAVPQEAIVWRGDEGAVLYDLDRLPETSGAP